MKMLGIESSCDETAAAIVEDGKTILTNVVASSALMHQKYGGIVPEVAARKQIESIIPVLTEGMKGYTKNDIDAIAVTIGPGLIGSLLIGVETAKTLAYVWNKPIIPVNHVLAHMYANFFSSVVERQNSSRVQSRENNIKISFPAISLVVSGGHTELYLMKDASSLKWLGGTLDDAAGECFDKTGRLLGFENRGGPAVAAAAAKLKVQSSNFKVELPRPMIHDELLNFSFSGLKTAVLREWNKYPDHSEKMISALAYEIQEAITDVLVTKTLRAVKQYAAKSILVSGGVAANIRLTEKFNYELRTTNYQLFVPPPQLCVDSATYIAAYAFYHYKPMSWKKITAQPDLSVEV